MYCLRVGKCIEGLAYADRILFIQHKTEMKLQSCFAACLCGNLYFAIMAPELQPTSSLACDKSVTMPCYVSFMMNVFLPVYLAEIKHQQCQSCVWITLARFDEFSRVSPVTRE